MNSTVWDWLLRVMGKEVVDAANERAAPNPFSNLPSEEQVERQRQLERAEARIRGLPMPKEENDSPDLGAALPQADYEVDAYLASALVAEPGVREALGAVRGPPLVGDEVAIQCYTMGMLVWSFRREHLVRACYFASGKWESVADFGTPQPGGVTEALSRMEDERRCFFKPTGGFVRIWLEHGLESALGWPEAPELRPKPRLTQDFENGWLVGCVPWWDRTEHRWAIDTDGNPDDGRGRVLAVVGADSGDWMMMVPGSSLRSDS